MWKNVKRWAKDRLKAELRAEYQSGAFQECVPKPELGNESILPLFGGLDYADVGGVEAAEALYRAGGGEFGAGGFGVAQHGYSAYHDACAEHGAGREGYNGLNLFE